MRVLVFGAGAIGSFLGALLSMENDVTLVARPAHVASIRRGGLRITGATELVAHPDATSQVPDLAPDVVFVATKAYDTSAAADALRAFAHDSTVVTLQNGLGNAEALAARFDRVAAGTTTHGVTFVAPGEIVHAGVGDTLIGPFHGLGASDVRPIATALDRAGIATSLVHDVRPRLWEKAVVNAAINPLTAILRVPNGVLVASEDLRHLLRVLAREGAAAARAAGVPLDAEAVAARVLEVATRTAANRSSMLQDVLAARRTEIDAITGSLLRAAAREGLELPFQRMVFACVRGLERGARSAGR